MFKPNLSIYLKVVIRQDRDDGFEHKDHSRQPRPGSGSRGSSRSGRSVAAEVYKVYLNANFYPVFAAHKILSKLLECCVVVS